MKEWTMLLAKGFVVGVGILLAFGAFVLAVYAADIFTVDRDGTIHFVVTSDGNVGINTGVPSTRLNVVGGAFVDGYGADGNATVRRANGTAAVPTPIVNGDRIGLFGFRGFDTSGNFSTLATARTSAYATENWTSTNHGTALSFDTMENGAAGIPRRMVIDHDGDIGIGTTSPTTSAKLDIAGTNGALLIPRLTTAQRDALTPANGMIIYNASTNAFNFYESGVWGTK